MSDEYLDTNNNSNAVNKMMTRLMNATANSLHSSSNSSVNSNNGEATPLIVATAAAGSTVNESAAACSSSSLTSLIKVSGTLPQQLLGFARECTVIKRSTLCFLSLAGHRSPRSSHFSGKT